MFNLFKKHGQTDLAWMETDVHSHLLPGIDDGVKDVHTGVTFIKRLMTLGLKQFVLTPHVYNKVFPNTPEIINTAHEDLYAEMQIQGLEDVYTHSSGEYMLGEHFEGLLKGEKLRAFPTNHILIELPWIAEPFQLQETLFEIAKNGYTPILAHPERYTFYFNRLEMYHQFKELGCLLQLNLLSPTGHYGKDVTKTSRYLMKNNLYNLAGTDLHNERHLDKITKYVKSGNAYNDLAHLNLKNKEIFEP